MSHPVVRTAGLTVLFIHHCYLNFNSHSFLSHPSVGESSRDIPEFHEGEEGSGGPVEVHVVSNQER